MMMRKGIFLILILLFPSLIYMLFSLGEHNVEKIGAYGDFTIDEHGDTTYLPVPDVQLTDHRGTQISLQSLRGKVVVVDVFRFPCDSLCRKKGATMGNYLNELGETNKWAILSIAYDDDMETSDLLRLQQQHFPQMSNWLFAKPGDISQLRTFIQRVYVDNRLIENPGALPASELVLIDQGGVVRAFFDARIYKENRRLEDAIKVLLQEPHMTWKDGK